MTETKDMRKVVLHGTLSRKCWDTFIVNVDGVDTRFSHIMEPAEDFRGMRIGDQVEVTAIIKPRGEMVALWMVTL